MKKILFLIIAALILISGIMFRLIFSGVVLSARPMAKWSQVQSASEAGHKVARFMFPILEQNDVVTLVTSGSFGEEFYEAFKREARAIKGAAQILNNSRPEGVTEFQMILRRLDPDQMKADCQKRDEVACVGLKAQKKFLKKDRDLKKLWFTMYRLNSHSAVLFYRQN